MELKSVLLLARHESLVSVDKQMLRHDEDRAFRRFSFMDSGLKAAQTLAAAARSGLDMPGLIVCDLPLSDMTALQFLGLIRLHPDLRRLPVLVLGHSKDIHNRDKLEQQTPVVCLERPYARQALTLALNRVFAQAALPASPVNQQDGEAAFRAALRLMTQPRKEKSPEELLRHGLDCLRRNNPFEARKTFKTVMTKHPAFTAQCLQGLAEVESRQGNLERSRQLLYKAAIINIRSRNFQAAERALSRLGNLRGTEEAAAGKLKVNPLYQAGTALIQSGHFEAAAAAFWHGMNLTPADPMLSHISRACQFTGSPERAAQGICRAMDRKSPSLGRDLRKALLNEEAAGRGEDLPVFTDYGPMGNFIANIYNVAKYTVRMYRHA